MKKVLKYLLVVVVFVDAFTGVLYAKTNTTQYKEYKTGAVGDCGVSLTHIYADALSVNGYGSLHLRGRISGTDIYEIYPSGACKKVARISNYIVKQFAVDGKRKFIYTIGLSRKDSSYVLEKYNFSGKLIKSTKIPVMTNNGNSHILIGTDGSVYVTDSERYQDNGHNRINKFSASGKYLLAWGGKGDGDGQFQRITSIAVDKENKIYVLDGEKSRVQKFDSRGNFITKWGEKPTADHGIYELDSPGFVGVDKNLNVYVSTRAKGLYDVGDEPQLKKFHNNGDYIGTIRPKINTGLWLEDQMDAVGNIYSSEIIVNKNFHLIGGIGSKGRKYTRGEHVSIQGIVFDSQNNMYTIDTVKSAIQKFSKSGKYIKQWGEYGAGKGQFGWTYHLKMAINNYDEIYVLDSSAGGAFVRGQKVPVQRIHKFTNNGKLLQTISLPNLGITEDTDFVMFPSITIDKNNNLYVLEARETGSEWIYTVYIYNRSGKKLRSFKLPEGGIDFTEIDIDKRRNLLYVTRSYIDNGWHTKTLKFTLSGKLLRSWPVPTLSSCFVFKNGNLGYPAGKYLYIYSNSGLFIRKEEQYKNISLVSEDKFGSVYTVHNLDEDEYYASAKIYKKSINPDIDHDGVVNEKDAFPFNSHEWLDTDHDGIGNNADKDDDNDGLSDAVEKAHKLNPLKASDAQADFDHDGFSNAVEINAGTNIRSAKSRPIWTPVMMGDLITFLPAKR